MSGVRVKICGIKSPEAFDATVESSADWLGFVFFPPSPRYISGKAAARLSARNAAGPLKVGLFVNPTSDNIRAVLDDVRLDVLQIYGTFDPCAFRTQFGLPIWRAVGVDTERDLPAVADNVDALLLEAKPPAASNRPGGNAARFDWALLRGWKAPVPWVLAGGLDPENVAEAVHSTGAQAVDVSSGVERERGRKDPDLIRSFVANARQAHTRSS